MPRKKSNHDLLKGVPSPTTIHTRIMSILVILLMFSVVVYLGSITYTGLAVSELNNNNWIRNQNIVVSNQFEVLEITKASNSVLDINIDSTVSLNIFAEIDDCPYWKEGKDRDTNVLYALDDITGGNFDIGNPSEKTTQSVELYNTENLCLIFINKEFPKAGSINMQYNEKDVRKWRIL